MPSVINANPASSEMNFVSDKPIFYNEQLSSSSSSNGNDSPKPSIHGLKESNRRRQLWSDPDDEFSVPIHTEFPLITKSPLDMASFLLNHRTMHRSIEIMIPPPAVNEESSTSSSSSAHSSSFYPVIPDGPIFIHHRSTMTGSPVSSVVSCSHIHCYVHNRHSIARTGPSACQKNHLLSASQQNEEDLENSHHSNIYTHSKTLPPSNNRSSTQQQKHSFLESHIASIDQWLSSKSGSI